MTASAQVAPTGSHHSTVGPGTGATGSASPTGGFVESIPLDLPEPRGRLPIPLSVVYNGSARGGAAGIGWDVPISYVRRSNTTWKRKPLGTDSPATPRVSTRMIVSLGGQSVAFHGGANALDPSLPEPSVWTSHGGQYMELRRSGDSWVLRTLDNLEYTFRAPSSTDPVTDKAGNLWLLTQVRDTVGGDRVKLEYGPPKVDACSAGLALKKLSYTFDASGSKPLYEIDLEYQPWDGSRGCLFDRVTDDQLHYERGQLLHDIKVRARDNLQPDKDRKVIRSYHFTYKPDADTERPRLEQVTTTGEDGVPGPTLPIATYSYGSLTRPPTNTRFEEVQFGPALPFNRPYVAGAEGYAKTMAATMTIPYPGTRSEVSRALHTMRDFTGDGLPDLLYKHNDTWYLHENTMTPFGPVLATTPSTWSQPQWIQEQVTTRTRDADREGRRKMITTETWVEFRDWNGDGKLDIVDAGGGSDKDHWKIWINRGPQPGGAFAWNPIEINVRNLRRYLVRQGYVDDDQRIPISRDKSWPRVEAWYCSSTRETKSCTPDGVTCSWTSGPATDCTDPDRPSYSHSWEVQTLTDWSVFDHNGDGWLDFVTGTIPVMEHETGEYEGDLSSNARCGYREIGP